MEDGIDGWRKIADKNNKNASLQSQTESLGQTDKNETWVCTAGLAGYYTVPYF